LGCKVERWTRKATRYCILLLSTNQEVLNERWSRANPGCNVSGCDIVDRSDFKPDSEPRCSTLSQQPYMRRLFGSRKSRFV
jgi:hypothetical protein